MIDQTWNPLLRDQLTWRWSNHLAEVCLLCDLHLHTHQQARREAS